MNHSPLHKNERRFVPLELNMVWEEIHPLYVKLLERDFHSAADLEQWMLDRSELEAVIEENAAWRYIRMTCNTADPALVEAFQYFATEIEPKIAPINNELNEKLIHSTFLTELDEQKYFVYLRGVKKSLELFRQENIPIQTEIQLTQQEYQSITSEMSVVLDGKEYTLEQASAFLRSTDRQIRQNAWQAISERRLRDKNKLDELFNKLVKLRQQIAKNAGFDNFRDYMFAAMGRFDYNADDCMQFHQAIERTVVPVLKERAERRKKALGLDQLKPWDMEVDSSGKEALKPFQGGDDLIEKTLECFTRIDQYLGYCIRLMKENNLFDLESRKGKAPGGYNYPLAESGAPFIFMNSANTFRDLTTMLHEGGHVVHTFISSDLELNDFKHLPSEVAELASMSMELISMSHWDVFFDEPEDLKRAMRDQLSDVLKTLPW